MKQEIRIHTILIYEFLHWTSVFVFRLMMITCDTRAGELYFRWMVKMLDVTAQMVDTSLTVVEGELLLVS